MRARIKKCLDALNRQDLDEFTALFLENVYGHWNGIPGDNVSGLIFHYSKWFEAFPDAKATLKRVFSTGNLVAAEFTWEVTHTGTCRGLPQIQATGRKAIIDAALIAERAQYKKAKIILRSYQQQKDS